MAGIEYRNKSHKIAVFILFDVFIIGLLVIYFGIIRSHNHVKINGTYIMSPADIAEFHFIDNHGMPFSKKNLQGHWSMIFFGFTHCAMVCPTTMAELNKMYKRLQQELPENQLPQIVFISVDPDRDTVSELNKFVNLFNPHSIGVRADMAATIALEKQLHVAVSTNPINHSMEILLLNPSARVQAYFTYPHYSEQLAVDYQLILAAKEK